MRCVVCKTKFEPKYFLQKSCLEPTCIISHSKAVQEKQWKARKKEGKEKLKTLSDYENEAKKVFQRYIRLRDKDLPCISCPAKTTTEWQGSHYFNANQFSGYIFNPLNCHKSCEYCNKFLHGNLLGYREGLKTRIGPEALEKLESEANENRNFKYTKNQLIEIKKFYQQKIKEL